VAVRHTELSEASRPLAGPSTRQHVRKQTWCQQADALTTRCWSF